MTSAGLPIIVCVAGTTGPRLKASQACHPKPPRRSTNRMWVQL